MLMTVAAMAMRQNAGGRGRGNNVVMMLQLQSGSPDVLGALGQVPWEAGGPREVAGPQPQPGEGIPKPDGPLEPSWPSPLLSFFCFVFLVMEEAEAEEREVRSKRRLGGGRRARGSAGREGHGIPFGKQCGDMDEMAWPNALLLCSLWLWCMQGIPHPSPPLANEGSDWLWNPLASPLPPQ